jgi:hypothetical protein
VFHARSPPNAVRARSYPSAASAGTRRASTLPATPLPQPPPPRHPGQASESERDPGFGAASEITNRSESARAARNSPNGAPRKKLGEVPLCEDAVADRIRSQHFCRCSVLSSCRVDLAMCAGSADLSP